MCVHFAMKITKITCLEAAKPLTTTRSHLCGVFYLVVEHEETKPQNQNHSVFCTFRSVDNVRMSVAEVDLRSLKSH